MSPTSCQTAPPRTRRGAHSTSDCTFRQPARNSLSRQDIVRPRSRPSTFRAHGVAHVLEDHRRAPGSSSAHVGIRMMASAQGAPAPMSFDPMRRIVVPLQFGRRFAIVVLAAAAFRSMLAAESGEPSGPGLPRSRSTDLLSRARRRCSAPAPPRPCPPAGSSASRSPGPPGRWVSG